MTVKRYISSILFFFKPFLIGLGLNIAFLKDITNIQAMNIVLFSVSFASKIGFYVKTSALIPVMYGLLEDIYKSFLHLNHGYPPIHLLYRFI